MNRLNVTFSVALLLASTFAVSANAESGDVPVFYGRGSIGLGYAQTGFSADGESIGDQDVRLGGFAFSYDLAAGIEFPINLAVFAGYRGWATIKPKLKIGGDDFDLDDSKLTMHNFGGGIAFTPSRFMLSAMVGPAWMRYKYSGDGGEFDADTKDDSWGIGAEVGIGYAFFQIPVLEIGLGGFASYHWIAETRDSDEALTGFQASGRLYFQF